MPVGNFIRCKKEDGYHPIIHDHYQMVFHWLDWLERTRGISIQHKRNRGVEKRIGPYYIDGYDSQNRTCYEYHGCYWHFHTCQKPNERWKESPQGRHTSEGRVSHGARLFARDDVGVRFYEFFKRKRGFEDVYSFSSASIYKHYPSKVDVPTILSSVENDLLFGFFEVDIEVPAHWWEDHPHNTPLTPHEYFSEMCPLLCTASIPYEAIGEHMQHHVEMYGISKNPRMILVSGL